MEKSANSSYRNQSVTLIQIFAALAFAVLMLALLVSAVAADAVYHSDHVDFHPVDGAPLRSGFLENIHANGPQIYAVERYVLNGASPNTSYYINAVAYFSDPTCQPASPATPFPATHVISTNGAGNGTVKVVLAPDDVPPGFAGLTIGIRSELSSGGPVAEGGTVEYVSECLAVTLD